MRLIFGLVLLVGLGLAGCAVYLAQGYFNQTKRDLAAARAQQVALETVVVAREPLRYGQQITLADLRPVLWPEESMPDGVFRTKEELFPEGQPQFRTVLRAMEAGEPLLQVKVTDPGADAGITSRLTKGMRAFAIRVDVSSGVSGFLRPGDRVDIYWSGESHSKHFTKLIEPGIRLIAIDQIAHDDTTSPVIARTVTVEVSPQQVAALAQAQSIGRLSLALVGANDDVVAKAFEVDHKTLLGIEDAPDAPPEEKRICTIRTRRGSEVMEIAIPCTN
ncbi:Flp pilus assembly protein CpaB [Rhodovulum sulfidophilum]|uniref:Flp pilus assembly protein CpaB n=1 Tax=Rhodovulum sulfidophilum TaxID=35806 RepID=UPI001924F7E5|nr:Flp pilus assembly protein CpaB [Rhodovulum sulfidophilum]MBL3572414.1 Flp pilus assembly protein CpaB [Rhodovulum sulfidophilum]MCE8432789.1 Flp pilus assembly protein CpaB [Rhodovulum sulfidophilum]MCF4116491.1 Flp pilus assembly protein CpaB [Rhodovulum sulfidophilum]